jgi:hypothetical protein
MMSFTMCVGYPVVQLVEALRYNLGGHGLDSRWCYDPGVDSSSNVREYQKYFLEVKAAIA